MPCRPFSFLMMLRVSLVFLAMATCAPAQNAPVAPNWALPQNYNTSQSAFQHGGWVYQAGPGQSQFTFTIASTTPRATSAAVFTTSGTLVRTLWMNRAYPAGTWGEIWDGKDDYGNAVTSGAYTIKMVTNSVTYTWDGLIGNTETDWGGPANLDNTGSYPRSIAFINGKGCWAAGYDEGSFATYCFPESTPNTSIQPLTRLYQGNMSAFDIVTDGLHYYELWQGYISGTSANSSSGIVAFNPDGTVFNFSSGTATGAGVNGEFVNNYASPATNLGTVKVVDRSLLNTAVVTGVAVERNGSVMATAHGEFNPLGDKTTSKTNNGAVASADKIYFWNKTTGAALGSFSVPNPQKMAFDLNNNLWIVSGFATSDVLYKVTGIGSSGTATISLVAGDLTTPFTSLSNPVSVAVSPTTGDLFVADGGINQQVFEYNTTTNALVSTLGTAGGFGSGASCNPAVTNTKFWFDPGPSMINADLSSNSPWVTGIDVDENGGLWVMDQTDSRIMHYTYQSGAWTYVNRIMGSGAYNYFAAATDEDPTRVFGGFLGWDEFSRDYTKTIQAGDPEATSGNLAWKLVRNWLPCVVSNSTWNTSGHLSDAFTLANGTMVIRTFADSPSTDSAHPGTAGQQALFFMNTDGTIKFRDSIAFGAGFLLEPGTGAYYQPRPTQTGNSVAYNVTKSAVSGYDSQGFPNWASPVSVATYTADLTKGNPRGNQNPVSPWPTTSGIMPMFDTVVNTVIASGAPAFHLGGLPTGGTALKWQNNPQLSIPYADGNGTYPAALAGKNGGDGNQGGTMAIARDNNIFAFYNGNFDEFGCQTYHFTDDGMFVGQFGYLPNAANATPSGISPTQNNGYPIKETSMTLAPGYCGDVNKTVFVKPDSTGYYMFLPDEGYHHGMQEWHITNLGSIAETNTAVNTLLGDSTTVTANPTTAVSGQSVTLTATVTPTSGTLTPTGRVYFSVGSTQLGYGTCNGSGVATLATTALPVGYRYGDGCVSDVGVLCHIHRNDDCDRYAIAASALSCLPI